MANKEHRNATEIHKGAYVQTSDLGSAGAGVLWVDTSDTKAPIRVRNPSDNGWNTLGRLNGLDSIFTYRSSDFGNLSEALTEIGSAAATLILNGNFTVNTNETIPTTVTIYAVNGGKFVLSSGVTLKIRGSIVGDAQLFSGTGTVKFDDGWSGPIHASWWGARSSTESSTVDCTPAIQAAIDAAKDYADNAWTYNFVQDVPPVQLPGGRLYISEPVHINRSGLRLLGSSRARQSTSLAGISIKGGPAIIVGPKDVLPSFTNFTYMGVSQRGYQIQNVAHRFNTDDSLNFDFNGWSNLTLRVRFKTGSAIPDSFNNIVTSKNRLHFHTTADAGLVLGTGYTFNNPLGSNGAKSLFARLRLTHRTVTDGVTNGTTTVTSATANFTSNDVNRELIISASGGYRKVTIDSVTNATTVVVSSAIPWSSTGNKLEVVYTAFADAPGNTLAINTAYEAELSYNGSTLRLRLNGTTVSSVAATGTIRREIWEVGYLGPTAELFPEEYTWDGGLNGDGILGQIKLSNAIEHASDYTATGAAMAGDSNTTFLLDWNTTSGICVRCLNQNGGWYTWLAMRKMTYSNDVAFAGVDDLVLVDAGLYAYNAPRLEINNIHTVNPVFGVRLWNNVYESTINRIQIENARKIGITGTESASLVSITGGLNEIASQQFGIVGIIDVNDIYMHGNFKIGLHYSAGASPWTVAQLTNTIISSEDNGGEMIYPLLVTGLAGLKMIGGALDVTYAGKKCAAFLSDVFTVGFFGTHFIHSNNIPYVLDIKNAPAKKVQVNNCSQLDITAASPFIGTLNWSATGMSSNVNVIE